MHRTVPLTKWRGIMAGSRGSPPSEKDLGTPHAKLPVKKNASQEVTEKIENPWTPKRTNKVLQELVGPGYKKRI